MTMKNTKQLLGISLALIMLVGSTPLGYSEPLRVQLEQGIETDQIQCDNVSHVLVERTNGKLACVTERTAERTGWEIINQDDVVNTEMSINGEPDQYRGDESTEHKLLQLSDTENVLQITNEGKSQNTGYVPNHLGNYPSSLMVPSTVELNQPFEAKYTWQFLEIEIDDDDPTDIDIRRASEQDWFTDRYSNPLKLSVNIPAKVEFVNYQELGYMVIDEDVHPFTHRHTIDYAKEYEFDDTEIQEETIILKFTSMPSENVLEGFGMDVTWLDGERVVFLSEGNSITLTTKVPDDKLIPMDSYVRGLVERAECDEKCQYYIDNTRDHVKYQQQIMFKYLENNTLTFGTGEVRGNYFDYLYHNTNTTFKDFLQSKIGNSETNLNSKSISNTVDFSNEINSIVIQLEKEKAERQANKNNLPEDVNAVAEMLQSMIENGIPLEDIHAEILPTYKFSDSFLKELFETHPDLALQSTELNTQSFFPSLNWILPFAFGQTTSTVTVYGNAYDDDTNKYLSDIKVCIYDTYSNSLYRLLLKEDGSDACVYSSGSLGSFTLTDVLSTDPNNDGTSADYLAVILFENEDKVKIMNWKGGHEGLQYDTNNIKTNGGYSGYIGAGRIDVSEDGSKFFTLYNTLSDIYDTGKSYKSGIQKVDFYYSTDDDCVENGYASYDDNQYENGPSKRLYDCNGNFVKTAQGESRIWLDYRLFDGTPIISHEYGHFLHDEIGESKSGSLDDPYNCYLTRFQEGISECNRYIINEGFAEYFSLVYANSGTVDFTTIDTNLGSPNFVFNYLDYENRIQQVSSGATGGFSHTITLPSRADVTSAFWDIADSNNDSDLSDVNKKDDLSYGYSEVISELDTFDSIFKYQTNWEKSNNSLDYVFYLNEVDKTFQGTPSLPPTDSFSGDFENGSLDSWRLSGDNNWDVDDDHLNHPSEPSNNEVATSNNCDNLCIITMAAGVKLSQYTSATLWFDKFIDFSIDSNEGLYVYTSVNGGDSWSLLATYTQNTGDDTNQWTGESYDLGNYLNSGDFKVRFVADSSSSAENVEIDNVAIIGSNSGGGGSNPHDTTSPVITRIGASSIDVAVGTPYSDAGATANDNKDGNITDKIVTVNPVDVNVKGTYTITYNVSDIAHNQATTVTRTVNVVSPPDTTAPRIDTINRQDPSAASTTDSTLTFRVTFDEDVTGVTQSDFTTAGTATSSVTGITANSTVQYDVDVTVTADGTVSLGLKSTGHGIADTATTPNSLTNTTPKNTPQTYTVTLPDTTLPVITLTGTTPIDVEYNSTYTDAGATASDNVDGNLTSSIVTVNPVDTSVLGAYTVTYNVSDSSNNKAIQVTRTVNVVDTTAPRIDTINRQDPSAASTTDTTLTFRVTFDESVTGVDYTDFTTGGTATSSVTGLTENSALQYDVDVTVTDTGDVSLVLNSIGHGISDTATTPNSLTNTTPKNTPQIYTVTTSSWNSDGFIPINGITIPDKTKSDIESIEGSIGGGWVNSGTPMQATYTEINGLHYLYWLGDANVKTKYIEFTITDTVNGLLIQPDKGRYGTNLEFTLNQGVSQIVESSTGKGYGMTDVTIYWKTTPDTTPSRIDTINRQDPLVKITTDTTLTFRVTFDESVTGVDYTDFTTGGTATSSVTGLTENFAVQYDVDVTVTAIGTVSLGLKSSGHGITDTATTPNSLTNTTPKNTPQTYTVTLLTVPNAPTNLTAIAGNSQVTLNWIAPTLVLRHENNVITDYLIEYKLSSESTWSTFADGTSTSTSATVTGLSNGQSYDFRVSAINDIGTGPPSAIASATLTVPNTTVTWQNMIGVTASGNDLITSNWSSWGSVGASSIQSLQSGDDGYVTTTIDETFPHKMIGLSNGDSNQHFKDGDFFIYVNRGVVNVYESGNYMGKFGGALNSGDILKVAVESDVVKYYKNDILFYTSLVSPTYPLLVDTSFYGHGGTTLIDVQIGGNWATVPP